MRSVLFEQGDVARVVIKYALFSRKSGDHQAYHGQIMVTWEREDREKEKKRTMIVPIIPPTKRGRKARPSSPLLKPWPSSNTIG